MDMDTIVQVINFVRSRALNHRMLKSFCQEHLMRYLHIFGDFPVDMSSYLA